MNGTTFPGYQGQGQHDDEGDQPQERQQQNNGGYQGNGSYQGNSGNGGQRYGNNNGGYQGNRNGGGGGNGGGYQSNRNGGNWQGNRGGWQGNRNNNGGGNWQSRPKSQDDGDLSLYKPYAVTGNQDFPPEIKTKIEELVVRIEAAGYTTRTGGMEGLEEVAEKAAKKLELHLPWRGFNNKESRFTYNSERAFAVAKMFHPTFDGMSKGIQTFLAKNARVIMGDKMNSPALFLLCWTEDGVESARSKTARTGFTGHPIAIASAIGIPIFNLGKPDAEQRLNFYLESTKNDG